MGTHTTRRVKCACCCTSVTRCREIEGNRGRQRETERDRGRQRDEEGDIGRQRQTDGHAHDEAGEVHVLQHIYQPPQSPRSLQQDYAWGPVVILGGGRFLMSEVPL